MKTYSAALYYVGENFDRQSRFFLAFASTPAILEVYETEKRKETPHHPHRIIARLWRTDDLSLADTLRQTALRYKGLFGSLIAGGLDQILVSAVFAPEEFTLDDLKAYFDYVKDESDAAEARQEGDLFPFVDQEFYPADFLRDAAEQLNILSTKEGIGMLGGVEFEVSQIVQAIVSRLVPSS